MKRLLIVLSLLALLMAGLSLAAGEWLTRPVRSTIGAPPARLGVEPVHIAYGDGQHVSG